MASVEPVKEKKKNKLRSRFLSTQCSSLDHGPSTGSAGGAAANQCTEREESRTSPSSSGSSRIRKMLFRRSRSEDRMRNIRIKENGAPAATSASRSRFPFGTASDVAANSLTQANHLMPQSPPPPYEAHSERESNAAGRPSISSNVLPPSYYEAVGQTSGSSSSCDGRVIQWTDPGGHDLYCMCHECQARYLTAEDEEPDNTQDNCADAVFPIETHFLMQEVLADGMAFCSLM